MLRLLKPKKEDDRECESNNGHRGRGGGGGISFFFNKRNETVTNMRERILSNEMRIDRKIGGGVRVSFLVELSGLSFSSIVYMSNALSVFHTHARARTHARIVCSAFVTAAAATAAAIQIHGDERRRFRFPTSPCRFLLLLVLLFRWPDLL